jgi:hypothetical protein
LILGLASTAHHRSIIFRREFTQLSAIIDRSKQILKRVKNARYNSNQHLWTGLPRDAQLEFGAMQREKDREDYQGRPHDLKAYDEITQFLEIQYRYTIGWNRSTKPGQRSRVVCTGNPPSTVDGEWVVTYWRPWLDEQYAYPAKPGELRWFATLDGKDTEVENGEAFWWKGEEIIPRSRSFIPARLSDNPYLSRTAYRGVLQGLPEPLRSQLLFGDFKVRMATNPWQVIPTEWVRAAQERWKQRGGRQTAMTSVGVDVARGGKDNTVITPFYTNYVDRQVVLPGRESPDGPAVAREVVSAIGLNPDYLSGGVLHSFRAPIGVDVIGVGSSVYDTLKYNGFRAVAVNVSRRSPRTDRTGMMRFANLRAAMWWALREALDPQYGEDLAIPPSRELLVDLCAPTWSISPHGIVVEKKEHVIERLGRSPDWGESLLIGYIAPFIYAEELAEYAGRGSANVETY